jgi:septal ring factor EnvC (AmiA/AmiB activator)
MPLKTFIIFLCILQVTTLTKEMDQLKQEIAELSKSSATQQKSLREELEQGKAKLADQLADAKEKLAVVTDNSDKLQKELDKV